ncbi:MFS transporter [Terrimonas pollutisoli]|uniref:MFS transporter n=1 Tax=Terrimonas pollutisoli TaxID=3034147 RepID=UPI0023ED35B7|nr:MFS transporter [Terrimonas sp. H1YJ31]
MNISGQDEKITNYHWVLFFICFLGTAFAGVVSTLMSVYLPVVVRELLGNRSTDEINNTGAWINSIYLFGAAFGGIISGIICDKAGRKTAVIFSITCYGAFAAITSFMPNWWAVMICRFFSGFGLGAILVSSTTLINEEWPAKTKPIFIGILSIAIPVGIFSAGLIDYFVSSWRQAFLVGIIPLCIAILSIRLLKESAKWKNRDVKLKPVKIVTGIFSKQYSSNLITGTFIFGTMLIGLWAIFLWIPTWIQGLIAEGVGQKERGLSMMMLGMGGLTGGFFSGWLMRAIGIRRSLLLCFSVCSLLSFLLFKTNVAFSLIIYPEIVILALFFGASQGVLSVFIPDLFPVAVRGTATGLCFNIGRLFTATAVLFVGILVNTLGGYGNSLFIFSLVFLLGLGITVFQKEKGIPVKARQSSAAE